MISMISVSSMALAVHTSSASLEPEWSAADADVDFTVTFCKNSGDDINEVRIYKNYEGSIHYTNFQCDDKPGWEKLYIGTYPACFYVAEDSSYYLDEDGECEDFTFHAHSPGPEYCNLEWRFETRDVEDYWTYLYDETSVDDEEPVIIKTLGEPKVDMWDYTWITKDTPIDIEVYDEGECGISGIDYCEYRYDVDGVEALPWTEIDWDSEDEIEGNMHYYYRFYYEEDSYHHLEIRCYDIAGNMEYHEQWEKVDTEEPETTKQFIGPQKPNPATVPQTTVEWIDGETKIELTEEDGGEICAIGTEYTYYRITPQDDEVCYDWEELCNPLMEGPDFVEYTEQIGDIPESCHMIEYYSVDYLGNEEPIKTNCFFVDKKAPWMNKQHPCGSIEDYDEDWGVDFTWLTTDMPITFTCDDNYDKFHEPQAHPSEGEKLCFQVSYDYVYNEITEEYEWGYITDQYCDPEYYYEEECGEGTCIWCCIPVDEETKIFDFYFQEESMHNLEYYCIDAVEKDTDPEVQYYKVDDTSPWIEKYMFGNYLGDCPDGTYIDHGDCYVADNGESGVTIEVTDGGEICAVDDMYCYYELWWESTRDECADVGQYNETTGLCLVDDDEFSESADVYFNEDSTHILYVYCRDALYNEMEHEEIFLVDSTPPETWKEYGQPRKVDPVCEQSCMDQCDDGIVNCLEECTHAWCTWWINSSTPVTLTYEDEKVSNPESQYPAITYWRNLYFEGHDEICYHETIPPVEGAKSGEMAYIEIGMPACSPGYYSDFIPDYSMEYPDWNAYDGEFYKEPESCHVIEYYSVDALGNEEPLKWQCVFVDNTPPEGIKEVGTPSIPGEEPVDWWVSMQTPIYISCDDSWDGTVPHPVYQETIYWRYSNWLDGFEGEPIYDPVEGWHSIPYEGEPVPITFPEDCWHDLEFYCVDHLGNAGEIDTEYFIVETVPPVIEKTVTDPQVDCPVIEPREPESCIKWDCFGEGDEKDFFTTGRHDPTNWDLAIKTPPEVVEESGEYVWTNGGEPVPFGLEYDADTGEVTYTVNGETLIWTYDSGKAFEYILLMAKGANGGCDMALTDVEVNGESVSDVISVGNYQGLKVYLTDEEQPDGFKVSGYAAMIWDDGCKKQEIPGFHIFAMNTHTPVTDCFQVDSATEITIDAYDPEPHPIDMVECDWWYTWDGDCGEYHAEFDGEEWVRVGGRALDVEVPFSFHFPEESEHILHVYCEDGLENSVDDAEMFIVDKTPPKIYDLGFGWPHYDEDICLEWGYPVKGCSGFCPKPCLEWATVKWISNETEITITIDDTAGPHDSGVYESKYRYAIVDDKYCWNESDCIENAEVPEGTEWTTMSNPEYEKFYINEESCHLIEIYSEDNVGKSGTHKQCVFVDNTGPEPVKTVGEPKDEWTPGENGDPESYFYPEETAHCWDGTNESIDCWEATEITPIVMDCDDSWGGDDTHPVGEKKVCFMVGVDGEDETKSYCREYGGWYNWKTGYCCRWLGPDEEEDHDGCEFFPYKDDCDEVQEIECYNNRKLFYFLEETEHNLKYYCIDKLWNEGPVDEEKFKIEGNKFEIPLFKKWNLISVPFTLLNDDPETVFEKIFFDGEQIPYENISEYIDSVWTYDPEHVICGQDWCVWTPGEAPDNLRIVPGWGYWVLVKDKPDEDCGWCFWHKNNEDPLWMVIGGSLFSPAETPPSRNLVKGWNLVGYYGTSWDEYNWGDFDFMCGDSYKFPDKVLYGDQAYCALNSLIDTQEGYPRWSSLWSFINCGNHYTDWLGLNSCPDSENPLPYMNKMFAGRGYWLEMDVEDIYAPATNCIWNEDFECIWTGGGMPV